jgi:basic amino acid/polyamine antiporter, APA family
LLISRSITWEFFVSANAAYWNYRWGFTDVAPPLGPVWPYPVLLALLITSSRVLQFIVVLAMSMWFFGWAGTVFLSSTRVIFAAAFDRLLPEKVAEVEPRSRTPIYALLLMAIPSLLIAALYSWDIGNFQSLTLTATLVIAITFLGSTIAAIILPYTHKELYEASPIAQYKIAGVPVISIAGVIFAAFLLFLIYQWLIDPNGLYGIGYQNTSSMIFIGSLYLMAALIYFAFKGYRRREGLDIDKIYQAIPVE